MKKLSSMLKIITIIVICFTYPFFMAAAEENSRSLLETITKFFQEKSVVFFLTGIVFVLLTIIGKAPFPTSIKGAWKSVPITMFGRWVALFPGIILMGLGIYSLLLDRPDQIPPSRIACDEYGVHIQHPQRGVPTPIKDEMLIGGVNGMYSTQFPKGWQLGVFVSTAGKNYRPKSENGIKVETSSKTWHTVSPVWLKDATNEETLTLFLVSPVGQALIKYHYMVAKLMKESYKMDSIWFPINIADFPNDFAECDSVSLVIQPNP